MTAVPSTGSVSYRHVLGNREFAALAMAQVTSESGDQIARVAVAVVVLDRSDSAFLAVLAFVAGYFPAIFGAALLSPLADRLSRRNVLLACDAVRVAVVLGLALVAVSGTPLWVLFALLFLAELFTAPFEAARGAVLPDIFPDGREYLTAAGLTRVLHLVNQVFGLVVAGVIVELLSARAALAIDAATFALSFVLILAAVRARPGWATGGTTVVALLNDFREGARLLFSDPVRRTLVLLAWGSAVFLIAPEGVALAYARDKELTDAAGATLMASIPAGAAVGAALVARLSPGRQVRLILPLATLACLPLLATSVAPPVPVAMALWFVSGALQGFMVPVIATVNMVTPAPYRGRTNGLAAAGFNVAMASAFLLAGLAADLATPAVAVTLAGALGLLVVGGIRLVWPTQLLHRAVRDAYAIRERRL